MIELMRRLVIRPGDTVVLLDPTRYTGDVIRSVIGSRAHVTTRIWSKPHDIIITWPRRGVRLASLFEKLKRRITPDGAVWAVMPYDTSPLAWMVNFDWKSLREAALSTDLVVSKTVALTPDEYATRFVVPEERCELRR